MPINDTAQMQTNQKVHSTPNRAINAQGTNSRFTLVNLNNCARILVAEFIGAFLLTWMHAGLALSIHNTAVELATSPDQRTTVIVYAFGAGLTLAGLVYGLGHISGGHFNPSISLVFAIRGDLHLGWLFPYVVIQIAGGFAAAGILDAVFIDDSEHGNLGANQPAGGLTVLAAFWMEFIASIFLQLAIAGTASRSRKVGGDVALAAGLTIGALIALLAPYGGGSMNPARSIGPGVLAASPSARESTWIYVVAPFGAALATGITLRWLIPKVDYFYDEDNHAEQQICRQSSPKKQTLQENNQNNQITL